MEKMPYQEHAETASAVGHTRRSRRPPSDHWRHGLPTLTGSLVTLRELRFSDAPALFAAMSTRRGLALHLAATRHG